MGFAVAFTVWIILGLWLLSWGLTLVIAAIQLVVELTLWLLLIICGSAMLVVQGVQTMGAHLARRRRRRPIHISKFDMA